MMRPTLYQLIQYVRDGETDPGLKSALEADPDSDRRLRRARFIYKMIGRQPKPSPIEPRPASFDAVDEALQQFDARHLVMDRMHVVEQAFESGPRYEPEEPEPLAGIRSMVMDSAVPGRDLGRLTASEQGGFVQLSLRSDHRFTETASGELRIDLSDYSISMSTRFPASEPLQLWFSDGSGSSYLSGIDVLFMPESGPFIRQRTDCDGVFALPIDLAPGMLRVSGRDFAFLRIARSE